MAVDTAAKRRYAIGARAGRLPWFRRFRLPYPDGTIDQGDRQQTIGTYGGIAAATLYIAESGGPDFIAGTEPIDFRVSVTPIEFIVAGKLGFRSQTAAIDYNAATRPIHYKRKDD